MFAYGKKMWVSAHNRVLWPKLTFHKGLELHHGRVGVDRAMADAARKIERDPLPEDRSLLRAYVLRRRLIWSSVITMVLFSLSVIWFSI